MGCLRYISKLFLVAFCLRNEVVSKSVIKLDANTLEDFTKEHSYALVGFFEPWCAHCKTFLPEFEEAANQLSIQRPKVHVGMYTSAQGIISPLHMKYNITSFPTLKWFVDGSVFRYSGKHTNEGVLRWVSARLSPPIKFLSTFDAVTKFKTSGPAVVVGYFIDDELLSKETTIAKKVFQKVSMRLEEIPFAMVSNVDVIDMLGEIEIVSFTSFAFIVYKQFDDRRVIFDHQGELSINKMSDMLTNFIRKEVMPLVVPFSDLTSSMIFGTGIDTQLLIFTNTTSPNNSNNNSVNEILSGRTLLNNAAAAASDYKGEIVFVSIPSSEIRVMSFFKIMPEDCPMVLLVDQSQGRLLRYKPKSELVTAEDVINFIEDFKRGAIHPIRLSENIPEKTYDTTTGLTKVVGDNFDVTILNPKYDAFVLYYAPWCNHCKVILYVINFNFNFFFFSYEISYLTKNLFLKNIFS